MDLFSLSLPFPVPAGASAAGRCRDPAATARPRGRAPDRQRRLRRRPRLAAATAGRNTLCHERTRPVPVPVPLPRRFRPVPLLPFCSHEAEPTRGGGPGICGPVPKVPGSAPCLARGGRGFQFCSPRGLRGRMEKRNFGSRMWAGGGAGKGPASAGPARKRPPCPGNSLIGWDELAEGEQLHRTGPS